MCNDVIVAEIKNKLMQPESPILLVTVVLPGSTVLLMISAVIIIFLLASC